MDERKERGRRRWREYNFFGISRSFVGSTKLLLDSCLSPLLFFARPPFLSTIKTFLPLLFHFIILLLPRSQKKRFITLALTSSTRFYSPCAVHSSLSSSSCFVSSPLLSTSSPLHVFVLSSARLFRYHIQTVSDIHTNSIDYFEIEKYLLYLILNEFTQMVLDVGVLSITHGECFGTEA